MWWVMAAMAVPPCPTQAVDEVRALAAQLAAIEPGLRSLVPDLPPLSETAWAHVRDDGTWLAVGSHFPPTCTVDAYEVGERQLWPMPGSGSTSLFTTDAGTRPILAVGTHDERRDGWDTIGHDAIIVHEWQHVGQALALRDAFPDAKQRDQLTRRFAKGRSFSEAVRTFADALKVGCGPDALQAYGRVLDELPAKLHGAFQTYVVVEGFARHTEVRYELGRRGEAEDDATMVQRCRVMEGAEFGYPVGCLLAQRKQRCHPDDEQAFHADVGRWLEQSPRPASNVR